jgi:hypothetical protein
VGGAILLPDISHQEQSHGEITIRILKRTNRIDAKTQLSYHARIAITVGNEVHHGMGTMGLPSALLRHRSLAGSAGTQRLTGAAFTVAASYPVCPRCGTTLCAIVEFPHDPRGATVLDDGPKQEQTEQARLSALLDKSE